MKEVNNERINKILEAIGATVEDLFDKRHVRLATAARRYVAYDLRQQGFTLMQIANILNKKHPVVIHYINTVKNEIETKNKDYKRVIKLVTWKD